MTELPQNFLVFFPTDQCDDYAVKGEELCIEDVEGGDYSAANCISSEAANTDLLVPFLILF